MTKQIHPTAFAARLLLIGVILPVGMQTAEAKIECSAALPAHPQGHWSYRLIDGRKCWYQGENNLSKSLLEWPQQPSALAPFSETQARLDEGVPPVRQTINESAEKLQNQTGPADNFEARWRGSETLRK
jgi:hypothetical protein